MARILKEKWFWIIVIALILVAASPFLFIATIMNLPSPLKIVATILIIVGWGIAAGYKDWAKSKQKEEKQPTQ